MTGIMTGIGALDTKKPHVLYVSWGLQCALVPVPGLEPGRREATDFESVVYTNFTTLAH